MTFRDGYAFGAIVAGIGVLAGFGLRTVDYEEPARDPEDPTGAETIAPDPTASKGGFPPEEVGSAAW